MTDRPPSSDSERTEQVPSREDFVQLFTRCQRRLYLFILAQVPSPVDAEEILQETNVVIWAKSSQFRTGTNFAAWATKIASYEVLKYRSRRRRDRHQFSDEFVAQVASEFDRQSDEMDARRQALARCLQKLQPIDRKLIQARYAPGSSGRQIADDAGRPVNSVYQSLGRIRRVLMDCVRRTMASEATP